MSQDKDLARLHELTQMVLDAALAELRQAGAEVSAIRAQMTALETKARNLSIQTALDAPHVARWQTWAAKQKAALAQDLARARAREEQLKQGAQSAFGRHQAIETLQANARSQARQKAARRAAGAG